MKQITTLAIAFLLVLGLSAASALAAHHDVNPCNPCAMKHKMNPCNPDAMKDNNPCAMKQQLNPCNPCAMKGKMH